MIVFQYLEFTLNRRGDMKEQIRELHKKWRIAANAVWGLGERICRDDFSRRWKLFNYLVRCVMAYGPEI